jgi:thiosulfate/3-mercaptopyruvate sulfurtransferase
LDYAQPDALVSTQWLQDHLTAPDVRLVDASWHLPSRGRNARQEYNEVHIPGAVFFDIDEIAATGEGIAPHMLPPPEKFASRVRKMGLGNGNRIVVYDSTGLACAAARVWWMFRYFGHRDVSVLDGGLPKWIAEGRATEDLPPVPRDRHFLPRVNTLLARDYHQLRANISTSKELVIDARSHDRFVGKGIEPWPVKHVGHIPGAVNVPYTDLINPEDGTMLSADALTKRFAEAGVTPGRTVVASCGSGVTACVVAFALHLVGHSDYAVYDGSWAEWGNRPDAPVERD